MNLGAAVDWEVSLPSTPYALAVYYIIAPSEASANLARYDGVKYGFSYKDGQNMWDAMEKTRQFGFGAEVKRRIMLGTYALSAGYYDAYYLKAQKVRTLIRQEFDQAFEKYDALITPTSPRPPSASGKRQRSGADVPERRLYPADQYRRGTGHFHSRRICTGSANRDADYR